MEIKNAATEEKNDRIEWKDLLIDVPHHEVRVKGKLVELTATEFKLLATLAQRRGRVQSRDQLLQDVWEYENIIDTRTVDTHMRRLREKLGPAARYLDTVRGETRRHERIVRDLLDLARFENSVASHDARVFARA